MEKGKDFIGVAVVYLCHDGRGRFLMHKRSANARDEKGMWDIGGGGVEFGADILETVRREIREEYGTDALQTEFLGFRDVHREADGRPTHWVALDFKVRVDPVQAKNNEPHKFDAIEWVNLSSLPAPMHSQLPVFFERYGERLR